MQQIYKRTSMAKCDFSKAAMQNTSGGLLLKKTVRGVKCIDLENKTIKILGTFFSYNETFQKTFSV